MKKINISTIWKHLENQIIKNGDGDQVFIGFVKRIFFRDIKIKRIDFSYCAIDRLKSKFMLNAYDDPRCITEQYLRENVVEPVFEEYFRKIKQNIEKKR